MNARWSRPAGLAGVLAILFAAGCGSSDPGSKAATGTTSASIKTTGKIKLQAGLLGDERSAGTTTGYVPKGEIVADSGFRPDKDGFAFENYGNDAGPVNLTPANVEDIFGNQVCARGRGESCLLIPPAKQWMEQENQSMAGGHCMGFSVSALRFFGNTLDPTAYGASSTIGLPVQDNNKLQSLIAEDFSYQSLPAVTDRIVGGTPAGVLGFLVKALKARTESYTLGILKADGTGGHAITPFAVEDRGKGKAGILVYDNNFPGVVRAVDVDTKANTWHYVGGTNPADTDEVYEGDANTRSMALLPTSPGEKKQPCPFCPKKARTGPEVPVPDRLHYIEVVLQDKGANHPHLTFEDAQGRKSGYDYGKFVNKIPGVKIVQNYSVRNWEDGPEPVFHLPLGHPQYIVTVDGSTVRKPLKSKITVNGAGALFTASDIHMAPGQRDTMILPAQDLGLTYGTTSSFPASVVVSAQFPQFDLQAGGPKPRARLITIATGSIGFKPNSPVSLTLQPAAGTASIDSSGAEPLVSSARFVLSVDTTPLYDAPEKSYITDKLRLDPSKREVAHFHYLRPNTPTLPVDITDQGGRKLRTAQVPPGKSA